MKKYVKSNTVDREYLYDKLQYAVDTLGADYVLTSSRGTCHLMN